MFEKYFVTVRRGQRIENNCTLLRNLLKVKGKPMSMREIREEIPSIQLTNHMMETLVRCKALIKEIRAEEIINKPFEKTILKNTLVTNDDGTVSAKIAWEWRTRPLKIYNPIITDADWMPEVYGKLYGIEKVQVRRAYYRWIGE